MPIPWAEIGLVLVLVVVNAAFAGSEVALISLREGQLRRLEHEGGRGRLVAQLAHDPNQFLSTIQIGITLAGLPAPAGAAVALAEPLVPPARIPGPGGRAGGRSPGHRDPHLPDPGHRGARPQTHRLAAARAVGQRRRPSP